MSVLTVSKYGCTSLQPSRFTLFVLKMNLFLVFILVLVSSSSQLSKFHGLRSDGDRHRSTVSSRDDEGLAGGRKGKEEQDIANCQSKDSLCDTVQQLSSIYEFLHNMNRKYPKTTKLNVIGRTHRHRSIYSLEIFGGVDREQCTTVVVEFGMHGREWVSQASAVYTIRRLLEQGSNLTTTVRWFILPVMNPDGYHHSTTKDNMWKKNRSQLKGSKTCFGVDVDRNFDLVRETNSGSNPCKEDYAGPQPFSESESKALKRLIESLGPFAVDAYISVHSCGQAILYPYGFSAKEVSEWKLERLTEAGKIMAKAMKKPRNRNYEVDVAYKLGGFRGTAADYMFDHFRVPYAFILELGDRMYFEEYDFHHCYHPPSTMEMNHLTEECYAGLTALASHVSATRQTLESRNVPRSFNSIPPVTCRIVPLFAFIALLL